MQYMGSKSRLSKELKPIIEGFITEKTNYYIEPFVGGANMIDKIDFNRKIGSDINPYLIGLLQYSQDNFLPETITEEEYNLVKENKNNYPKWYVGLVGFCGSFGSKFFGGFARRYNKDGSIFDVPKQAINSLRKQSSLENFKNIRFFHKSYLDYTKEKVGNCVIYCDIPYKDTTKYGDFDYDKFYEWAIEMSKSNTVLISEYEMPTDRFECIWEKEHYTSLGSGVNVDSKKVRIEKLFKVK